MKKILILICVLTFASCSLAHFKKPEFSKFNFLKKEKVEKEEVHFGPSPGDPKIYNGNDQDFNND